MFVKLFVVCVLFSSLVYCGNVASCCDVDHDPGDDTAWFVYAPPDVSIQCHLALMSLNQNYDPNFTGWGWEVNGCSASTPRSLICGGGTWCDDGGPGGGENAPLDDYDTDFLATICGTLSRSYTRTWYSITSCEDGSGIRSVTQTISIVDTIPPTLAVPADLEYECPPIAPNVNSISQMNNYFGSPDVMEFCQTLTDNDISQNPTTLSAAGVISRTFTVTDGCFTVVDTQTITLVDTTPPVLQRLPNVHYECGQIIDATAPNAQDTCYRTIDAGIPVIMNDVTYEGFCAGKYSMVRTWTASDTDGNTVRETQVIVVDDTIPPVITPTVDERIRIINVDCFSDINFPYTQEDVCSNVASLNVPYEISLSHNEDEGRTEVLVEYTSADLCGNSQKWADLWQVNSGIGVFSDVISGPYGLVDKGTVFTIIIDITTTNDCVPFGILLVDSGYATLQRGSDACFFQSATGVIYCDPVPTTSPYSLVLNLSVPADYLGDDLLVSISWHYNYRTIAVIVGSYLVSFNP